MPQNTLTVSPQRLEPFFEHWLDFETTDRGLHVPNGLADEGDGVALMPSMYRHPAVREFYRCTDLYRHYAPSWYWHLAAFYKCEWRQVRSVSGKRRDKTVASGWVPVYGPWMRKRVLPRGLEEGRVGTGVRFCARVWDTEIDPSLPRQLLAA